MGMLRGDVAISPVNAIKFYGACYPTWIHIKPHAAIVYTTKCLHTILNDR